MSVETEALREILNQAWDKANDLQQLLEKIEEELDRIEESQSSPKS